METGQGRGDLRDVVLSWERLRLIYNGLMLAIGLPAGLALWRLLPRGMGLGRFCVLALAFGLGANFCYLLGPVSELYWLAAAGRGFGRAWRRALFCLGLLLSVAVVAGICAVAFTAHCAAMADIEAD